MTNLPSNIKDLTKLVKFMRKAGVLELTLESISIKLSAEEPPKRPYVRKKNSSIPPEDTHQDLIPTDGLSDQELLFYSAGGVPEELKDN
jgi:hypothetical protein